MTVNLGPMPDSAPGGLLDSANRDVARLLGPAPQHLWVHTIRLYGGVPPGGLNQEIVAVVWRQTDGSPAAVRARSSPITVTAGFSGTANGQVITAPIAETVVDDDAQTAFRMPSGTSLYVGFHDRTGDFRIGMNPNGNVVEVVEGTAPIADPSSPFALVSRRTDLTGVSIAIRTQENRQPNPPTVLTPAANAEVVGLTPTFSGNFADWDAADGYGDKLQSYQIQVMRGTTLIWNREYDASNTERAAAAFSRPYEGSALGGGETLLWRCRVADRFTAYGLWSNQSVNAQGRIVEGAWTPFTVRGAGSATVTGLDSLANGKITNLSPNLAGPYVHANALAMNGVQVRILLGGTIVRGPSPVIPKAIASGGSWFVDWAQTGFAPLSQGNQYEFQARAQDTANVFGVWLPVPGLLARANALPATPSQLRPSGNIAVSVPPEVTFVMQDADDTVATGLNAEVEVTRPNGTVVVVAVPSLSEAAGTWRVVLSATQLTAYGTYTLRARGKDATSTGAWSAPSTFRYLQGPTVTITAPADGAILATNRPTISWTPLATQVSFRISVQRAADNVVVVDSGAIASTTGGSYVVPSGALHDGASYVATVRLTQSDGLVGYAYRAFTVNYPTSAGLTNVVISTYSTELDRNDPSAVLVSWEAPPVSTATFWQYVVEREEYGKPLTRRILAQQPSISATRFVDHEAASGVSYLYRVWWEEIQGTDIRPSVVAELLASVNLRSTIIHRVEAPEAARLHLPYYDDRPITSEPDLTFVPTWSGARPTAIGHPSESSTFSISTRLIPAPGKAPPAETLAQLDAIYYEDDPAVGRRPRAETVCVRTPLGDLLYGVITRVRRQPLPEWSGYTIDIDLTATNYRRPLTTG